MAKGNDMQGCESMKLRLVFIAFFIISLPGNISISFAVLPDEILANPSLEARARTLSSGLRCLVCQNETIDESSSPLARDLRLLIREKLQAGDSDHTIINYITARYGQFVLLRPAFNVKTALLWLSPLITLILAFGTIFLRWRRKKPTLPS